MTEKRSAGWFLSRLCLAVFIVSGAAQAQAETSTGQAAITQSALMPASPASIVTVDTTSGAVGGDTTSVSALLANRGSDGHISFAEAIAAVNNTGSGNTINFSLPYGSVITAPTSWILTAPNTTIDGGSPDVVMTAPAWQFWLLIRSAGNTIKNLAFAGLGIDTVDAHDNLVTGSYIGTDIAGLAAYGVDHNGVVIFAGAHHNIIEKNTIAGLHATNVLNDAVGVRIYNGAHDNIVRGNIFGINKAGAALPDDDGVYVIGGAYSNTIGGLRTSSFCDGPCNVISNNLRIGVLVSETGTTSNVVQGNYIGLNQAGTLSMGNGWPGIEIGNGASQNLVGGIRDSVVCDGPCNVISGNSGNAIAIIDAGTTSNNVQGNFIGLNPGGTAAIPNGILDFVAVIMTRGAAQNQIGGLRSTSACDGPCNVISGNSQRALAIAGAGTISNVVEGNYIGVNPTGATAMPNNALFGSSAVAVTYGASQNVIGGARATSTCDGPCNVISGNQQHGVMITGTGTFSIVVEGNYIGVNPFGTAVLANGASGVSIVEGAEMNTIGGDRASSACDGPCNVISGNGQNGVAITGTGTILNSVSGNYIGTDPSGAMAMSNAVGVRLSDHSGYNTIGGGRSSFACDGLCNVISGNSQQGISITASSYNPVEGNYIGLRPDGSAALGNGAAGIALTDGAASNYIGMDNDHGKRRGNVISGNAQQGVLMSGQDVTGVAMLGNIIGLNPTGTLTMSNGLASGLPGVDIAGGSLGNFIGTIILNNAPCILCGNVVSGNAGGGIRVRDAGSNDNLIQANDIGVGPDGITPQGNGTYGVAILNGATHNLIGGDSTMGCGGNCSNSNIISGNQQQGVLISGAGTISNYVQGNHIGIGLTYGGANLTVPNGTQRGYPAVDIAGGASHNVVGGTSASAICADVCNIISGNGGDGVRLRDTGTKDNAVQGNQIGVVGFNAVGNGGSGVVIVAGASNNLIGGNRAGNTCDGQCNVISANHGNGVLLTGTTTLSNAVMGNYIGLSPNDLYLLPMGNGASGVAVTDGAAQNVIGGNRASATCNGGCNVISTNQQHGVVIGGAGTISNSVLGNTIGLDAYGLYTMPNTLSGVFIGAGASNNLVGGARPTGGCIGPCNEISGNGRGGVAVVDAPSRGNTIKGNAIHENGKLGIDLGNDGLTRNGNGLARVGPNDFMNFPNSAMAAYDGVNTTLTGVVSTTYPLTTTIDLYTSRNINPSAYGEGEAYLGEITPDATGRYTLTIAGKLPYPYVSATATDGNGSTSEFSLVDTDGDSLPDLWELNGVTIGGMFINLPAMGANPLHKDLFVHADWMNKPGLKPTYDDMLIAYRAYWLAPLPNPNGITGIHLHVDLGPDSLMDPAKATTWGALSASGPQPYTALIGATDGAGNYDWSGLIALKTVFFDPSQRQNVFRYMCFCSNLGGLGTISGFARGLPGTDFLVTLDGWGSGGTRLEKAGTFMHELGHTLGLGHGGGDGVNNKPNYLSLMNYSFQTTGLLNSGTGQRSFDYSRRKLADIDETALDESIGISDPDKHYTLWAPLTGACAASPNTFFKKLAYPAIDWNCDGALTAGTIVADINDDVCVSPSPDWRWHTVLSGDDITIGSFIYDGPNRVCNTRASVGNTQQRNVGEGQVNVLTSFDDWAALQYSGGGMIGSTVSTTVLLRPSATTIVTSTVDEINSYEYMSNTIPSAIFNAEQTAPVDVVTTSVHYGVVPLAVHFDGTASYAQSGTVVSYTWDYGDGTGGSGPIGSHIYTATGMYFASLTITDSNGLVNLAPKYQFVSVAPEAIVFVNTHAAGSNHDGESWATAFTSLQSGIDAAPPGAEVWVAKGVYKPANGTVFISPTFLLRSNIAVYGGFAATETLRSQRNWTANITVLSGDVDNNDPADANGILGIIDIKYWNNPSGFNAWHVVTVNSGVAHARLDGFTITSGDARATFFPTVLNSENGGGMYMDSLTSMTLENINFSGNRAGTGFGGAMFEGLTNTTVLSNVAFMYNRGGSDAYGAGLSSGSSDNLINVTFTGNLGSGMSTCNQFTCNQPTSPNLNHVVFISNGGGMYINSSGNSILNDVQFISNGTGLYNGGSGSSTLNNVQFISNTNSGMVNVQITPTLANVTFQGNNAGYGGGMNNGNLCTNRARPTLINVTFRDNSASAGGGMYNVCADPTLINVSFIGNKALGIGTSWYGGGAMFNLTSSPTLINVLLISNTSLSQGGGIYNFYSHPTLVNVTMSGNTAVKGTSTGSGSGGAILNENASGVVLANSILWGDVGATAGPEIYNISAGNFVTATYSDIQWPSGLYTGTGNINANPLFINPITAAHPFSTATSYLLQGGSPAINAGNNLSVTVFTDLDGHARVMGLRVDMGAYEWMEVSPFQAYMPITMH